MEQNHQEYHNFSAQTEIENLSKMEEDLEKLQKNIDSQNQQAYQKCFISIKTEIDHLLKQKEDLKKQEKIIDDQIFKIRYSFSKKCKHNYDVRVTENNGGFPERERGLCNMCLKNVGRVRSVTLLGGRGEFSEWK